MSRTTKIYDKYFIIGLNSYLDGNQVYGKSTAETYVYALKRGCRAVESKRKFLFKPNFMS